MKARPILFSGPMVRALLEGRKTQTRRVIKPQPQIEGNSWSYFPKGPVSRAGVNIPLSISDMSPYGKPGDLLWVRETYGKVSSEKYAYRANPSDDYQWGAGKPSQGGFRWRPSIHMPRSVSRITLEITSVRVELLQDISPIDTLAEGSSPEMPFGTIWKKINTAPGI